MKYIDAKRLVELCLEQNLFNIYEDKILLYRESKGEFKEGWYATEKEDVIHEVKNDEKGQKFLINALKDRSISFETI